VINGLDLFSGIGGISLALAPWVRPIAYCEIEPYSAANLLSLMADGALPRAPIWDDIRTLDAHRLGWPWIEFDIIYGGFPCQDISIAGAGAGLEGERSGLYYELRRLVGELRPRFVFLENVPAITFRGLEQISLDFTALGYDSRWTIVSAGEVGACHLRERWWFCAHANGKGLQEPGSIALEESERKRETRDSTVSLVQRDFWRKSASDVCRMDDGLSPKTHRIKALGNAVVPLTAEKAFMRLMGLEPA
jgi:DNA (cytosine-5)-methyltransferase 1